jgi:hypothetical protein
MSAAVKKKRAKKMRRVRATDAREACSDIEPSRPPKGVPMSRWAGGMSSGRREGKQLGWYRGHHAGTWDAVLTVRTKYPRVAEELRKCFGLSKDGSLGG